MGLWNDSTEGQCDAGERAAARSLLNDFQMDCNAQVLTLEIHTQLGLHVLHKGLKRDFFIMRLTGVLCG